MSQVYWQAKIWGLLHDPALKPLHDNSGRGGEGFWQKLECMEGWVSPKSSKDQKEGDLSGTWLEHIALSDLIASASDRSAIHHIGVAVDYGTEGLQLAHLLSGQKLTLKLDCHQEIIRQAGDRRAYLEKQESDLIEQIPATIRGDAQKCFWWLWRCLPQQISEKYGSQSLLMPAETRFPDASIWSHATMTSALAGAFAGYDITPEEVKKNTRNIPKSQAYLAVFTFSPIQELIKASRKIKDFWAGSWILHYLSARVCWQLAQKYGPDCFLYPSLYGQPLIDHWLRQDAQFAEVISKPEDRQLLTAGFPNVIMLILPEAKVAAAMQSAKNYLLDSWREIAHLVFEDLTQNRHWQKQLREDHPSWRIWLDSQWQTYWAATAIGGKDLSLKSVGIPTQTPEKAKELQEWIDSQNGALKADLFKPEELSFIQESTQEFIKQRNRNYAGSLNIGSWWANIFDQARATLNSVKNARNWKLPTAFGPRSTVSGLGPVVHPQLSAQNWITEGETQKYWQRQAGLFDGNEQLNATETVKRGLEKILEKLLKLSETDKEEIISASYPDLTSGVAGYLNTGGDRQYFEMVCEKILEEFPWAEAVIKGMKNKWGIPLMDNKPQKYHPRLLNAGWLVEDAETDDLKRLEKDYRSEKDEVLKQAIRQEITRQKVDLRGQVSQLIDQYYPNRNPADWYVIAAGDGDSMSEWLKGTKMNPYGDYLAKVLDDQVSKELRPAFDEFKKVAKRMGPATHNALSRALLDFSNQLVPHLTEQRYAGRLIYSGGDDVLAYTNLWEWDSWLWDIRQCFRGDQDPKDEFDNTGNYWSWRSPEVPHYLSNRPLFTMGEQATISFGLVIAHHSVPLAIALENLWQAEEEAKEHEYVDPEEARQKKDAVQLRIIYGNGNVLKATSKFKTFQTWQTLLTIEDIEPSIYETAATLLEQHPIPSYSAIMPWINFAIAFRLFSVGAMVNDLPGSARIRS